MIDPTNGDDEFDNIVSISSLLHPSPTIRRNTCEMHGDFESRNYVGTFWSLCPTCVFQQIEKQTIEYHRSSDEIRRNQWKESLGRTGIPNRYFECRLGSYEVSNEGQNAALEFARNYADHFGSVCMTGRSAIFCGNLGTGKTHLAVAIAMELLEKGWTANYTTVWNLLMRLKETFRKDSSDSLSDVLKHFTSPDLLIIDEVGVQYGTDFEQNSLFSIINERYGKRRPTLFLSNLPTQEVRSFLGERIYDRLKEDGGRSVSFDWDSHREEKLA